MHRTGETSGQGKCPAPWGNAHLPSSFLDWCGVAASPVSRHCWRLIRMIVFRDSTMEWIELGVIFSGLSHFCFKRHWFPHLNCLFNYTQVHLVKSIFIRILIFQKFNYRNWMYAFSFFQRFLFYGLIRVFHLLTSEVGFLGKLKVVNLTWFTMSLTIMYSCELCTSE